MPPQGGRQRYETPKVWLIVVDELHAYLEYWFFLELRGPKNVPVAIIPSQLDTGFEAGISARLGYICGFFKWCWSEPKVTSVGGSFRADPFQIDMTLRIVGIPITIRIP